ncbi:hypothetical protein C7T94_14830 [Pedobacter yulinensis]|uniref:YdhG-like domain-containing protein n=2 Tax=Pedobacter yulinensis TaxID=2126353 RepID=A0A2T3HI25_9SPHI|nr:hypothetical protein C7T94_14830 [Pedobacter yulinensis]
MEDELSPLDAYFAARPEPERSCLHFLRRLILQLDPAMTEAWKYRMPFYYLHGKMFCYLRHHRQYRQPYIGIMEGRRLSHPLLLAEGRARVRILLVDPHQDLDAGTISSILLEARRFYPN